MVLGLSLSTFTFLHVLVSLVSIASGFVVVLGLIAGKRLPRWTALFLATTALTSLSGFLFPFKGFTPAIGLGVLSLSLLSTAVVSPAPGVGRISSTQPWRSTSTSLC
jgi:hypothetical protein